MNLQNCNKINNELVQVVTVLGLFKHVVMSLCLWPMSMRERKN